MNATQEPIKPIQKPIQKPVPFCPITEGWHKVDLKPIITIRTSRQKRDEWLEEERTRKGPDDVDGGDNH